MTECHDQQDVCFLTILNNATSCGGKTKINLVIIDYIRWQHTRAIVRSNKIMQILIECNFTWEPLTQWGLDKMAGILQTTASNAFSWTKLIVLWFTFHMMTSSNGNLFRVTGPLCGEFTGHRWIPLTKASDAELWCFFDLCLNKWLNKQSRRWWFETPSLSSWHHCNKRYFPSGPIYS